MIKAADLVAGFKQSYEAGTGYIWGKVWEYWTTEKQNQYARDYAKDAKRATSVQYGGKWHGYYVTDCSGLFTHWFEVLGGRMSHGSNTMYKDWCTAKGRLKNGARTDGKPLRPGTAVFTGDAANHDHVGLYIGDGLVIEAEGTKSGVIQSKISKTKWTYWGELAGVDYGADQGEPAADYQPDPGRPTLRRGSQGEYVTLLQTKLINRGYDIGSTGADGKYGPATQAAVKSFQRSAGLADDGIVGPKTWAALLDSGTVVTFTKYSVMIEGLDSMESADLSNYLAKKYPNRLITIEEKR